MVKPVSQYAVPILKTRSIRPSRPLHSAIAASLVLMASTVFASAGATEADLIVIRDFEILSEHVSSLAECAALPTGGGQLATGPGACISVTIRVENPATETFDATTISVIEKVSGYISIADQDPGSFDSLTLSGSNLTGAVSLLTPGESKSFSYRGVIR